MVKYEHEFSVRDKITVPDRNLPIPNTCEVNTDNLGEHGHPIPYDYDLALLIQREMTHWKSSNFDVNYKPPKNLKPEVRSEIYRFMLALKSYYESSNPILPYKLFIEGIVKGEEFLVFLKKLRSIHLVESCQGRFLENDPSLTAVYEYSKTLPKLHDIGDIFNVRYWFYWAQSDEHDWEACFLPIKVIPQEDLDILYQATYNMLPESIDTIEEAEILLSLSGSSAIPKTQGKRKTSPVFIEKQTDNYFSNSPLAGKGCFIDSRPGDTRYSIILSVPQSNSVKLIEKQVALIAAELPWSNYVKDEQEYTERYTKFKDEHTYFLCRDMKKDGLTKPRQLIQTVCKAIKDKYPHLPACKYFSIFDGFSIDIDGKVHYPGRGVGLGMTAALTTILQCALFKITLDKLYDEEFVTGSLSSLHYHDDTAVGATDADTLENYNTMEDQVMETYQLIKNKRKSFVAEWFILCENYSDEFHDIKESYQRYLINQVYASCNISHAKLVFGSNLRYINTVDWNPYLRKLVSYFGYEYFPDEACEPYQLGGWVPAYYMSVDIALYIKEPTRKSKAAALSFTLEKPNAYKQLKRYSDELFKAPVNQLYGDLDLPKEFRAFYYIGMTEQQVARKFLTMEQVGSKSGYWNFVYTERKKRFNQLMALPDLDIKEFYRCYHQKHNKVDILPPKELIVLKEVKHYKEVESLYRPSNPFLQFIKFFCPNKLNNKIYPWPVPPGLDFQSRLQLTAEERRQMQYNPLILSQYSIGELVQVNVPSRLILEGQYYNPNQMIACCVSFNIGEKLPENLERKELSFVKSINTKILEALSDPLYRQILERSYQLKPEYKTLLGLNVSTFYNEITPFINRRTQAIDLAKAYQLAYEQMDSINSSEEGNIPNYSEYTDTPLSDSEFWTWRTSKKKYKDWRNNYFLSIDAKVLSVELQTSITMNKKLNPNYDFTEGSHLDTLDPVELHLFLRSGGVVDKHNRPVVDHWDWDAIPEEVEIEEPPDPSEDGSVDMDALGW